MLNFDSINTRIFTQLPSLPQLNKAIEFKASTNNNNNNFCHNHDRRMRVLYLSTSFFVKILFLLLNFHSFLISWHGNGLLLTIIALYATKKN
jgi:hypothetical protein